MRHAFSDIDEAVLAKIQREGVTPALQARSQATFQALIRAGRQVMEEKDFDAVTISDIARTAGASVGAFYGRFANKEVFFAAIQEIAVAQIEADMRAHLAQPAVQGAGEQAFLGGLARFWVQIFRSHQGLYIAAFKHSRTRPGAWTPFKRLGHNIVSLVIAQLAPRLQALGQPRSEREIRIAFQFINGLLVNAVLNDPGPLTIRDAEMEQQVARFLCSYFGIPAAAAVPMRRRRQSANYKGTK